jgi:hypothetical protein
VYASISAKINVNPSNPTPKSNVTLTLESYSFDVDTAMITWKVDGKVITKGEGEKSFVLQTGNVGEANTVSVIAQTADGSSLEQRITITPSSVVLLFESPKSYVPVLYEGRSLPSVGGVVRVTALPQISDNGIPVSPSTLAYSWYLNDSIMSNISGKGKQSVDVRLDYFKLNNEIKVIARSPLGNSGTKKISILSHPVMPLLYTYDPIFGTNFTTLISKRFETTKDITIALEPMYISTEDEQKNPSYSWYLDGLPTTPLGGRILSLHPSENSYGTKMLSIKIAGPDKRIQQAETKAEIIFDTRK